MDGRAWMSGYYLSVDGGKSEHWYRSVDDMRRVVNDAGVDVSTSTLYAILTARDDAEAGRPNKRQFRSLHQQIHFRAAGTRGERGA